MREQLIQYVQLLFAGTTDTGEIQQEILQNTLDKYDDLISQGKSPEAAYRLAISGIGDINEILGNSTHSQPTAQTAPAPDYGKRKLLRSVAIVLYILSPVPLFISDGSNLGLCGLLMMVAIATGIMVYTGKGKSAQDTPSQQEQPAAVYSPKKQLRKAVSSIVWLVGTCVYFIVSFTTHAWWITWLIFPMLAAVQGLVNAIIDLKEACNHEG